MFGFLHRTAAKTSLRNARLSAVLIDTDGTRRDLGVIAPSARAYGSRSRLETWLWFCTNGGRRYLRREWTRLRAEEGLIELTDEVPAERKRSP